MRTAITTTLILATALALAPRAVAQPTPCAGRYAIDGQVDLGAGVVVESLSAGRRVSVGGGDTSFTSNLSTFATVICAATVVTQVPRDDAFILRAKYEACGERPKFRLRLKYSADCATVTGRVRAGGQLVDEFIASLVRVNPVGPFDPNPSPDATEPPVVPADDEEVAVTPIGTTPTISSFAPIAVRPGDTVSVFGTNLDRDGDGNRWVGVAAQPPFVVAFQSGGFRPASVIPTFVSESELTVVVPPGAQSGTIRLMVVRNFGPGRTLDETRERIVVVREEAPATPEIPARGIRPASQERGTLTVQATELSPFTAGTFPATSPFQIGAFLDANDNNVVDLFTTGRDDVPYLAAPVRTSEFDFTIQGGRGYFQGANAMLWVFFEGGNPNVLDNTDRFFVVHLAIDLAARTARPIAMQAGVAGSPGIVMLADTFATETNIQVAAPGGGVGAISGRIAAVPLFLESIFLPSQPGNCLPNEDVCADFGPSIETRLWSNGIVIDFDVLLFADSN